MAGPSSNAAASDDLSLFVLDERGNPVTLTLTDEGLTVQNSGKVRGSSSKKIIPYYNITSVELVPAEPPVKLRLDHVANPEKLNFKIEKESWAMSDDKGEAAMIYFRARIHQLAYPEGVKYGKRAYVLVNPNAGPGNGTRKWEQEVRPLFDAARMSYDAVILKKGGEATTLVQNLAIQRYDTIVAVSGDGTPHEIFNGLAKRNDSGRALRECPVSHIPTGSGNALSLNLYGSNKPGAAAMGIIKGHVTALDLVSVTQGNERILSFLSQALGIIAESDLGTEHLRWMGARRFELGLATRVYQKKCYPCDLAIKVVQDTKEGVKSHYRQNVNSPQSVSHVNGSAGEDEPTLPPLKYGTINDDLPEGWELVPYENIGNFYCGNLAFMAPDANFFPGALPSDGCMDLVRIDGDLPTIKATKTLLAVESGKFFDIPHVRYQKIEAYRIIPREQEDGYISVDGEKVPFQPFQAEIHQGLARVLSKAPGQFQAKGPTNWDSEPSQGAPVAAPQRAEDVTV